MGIARGHGAERRRNKTREGYNHDCTKIASDSFERQRELARTHRRKLFPPLSPPRPTALLADGPLGRGKFLPSLVSILCASSFLFLPCGERLFVSAPAFVPPLHDRAAFPSCTLRESRRKQRDFLGPLLPLAPLDPVSWFLEEALTPGRRSITRPNRAAI